MITQATVRTMFHYSPDIGTFKRIKFNHRQIGLVQCDREINSKNAHGYSTVGHLGKVFLVHRLIWLYMTGEYPIGEIDHIDGDKQNNKWENLRLVTSKDNSCNRGIRLDNSSGVTGVTKIKKSGKYVVRIGQIHIGTFNTLEEATIARKHAEGTFGYHPNHGERPSWRK